MYKNNIIFFTVFIVTRAVQCHHSDNVLLWADDHGFFLTLWLLITVIMTVYPISNTVQSFHLWNLCLSLWKVTAITWHRATVIGLGTKWSLGPITFPLLSCYILPILCTLYKKIICVFTFYQIQSRDSAVLAPVQILAVVLTQNNSNCFTNLLLQLYTIRICYYGIGVFSFIPHDMPVYYAIFYYIYNIQRHSPPSVP